MRYKYTAILAAAMAIIAMPSHADVTVTAKVLIDNFIIAGSDSLTPLDASTDFSQLAVTSGASMSGVLTGTGGFSFADPNGINVDFPSSCLSTTGDCNPLPENGFPLISGAQAADYVAADQLLTGAPFNNVPGFDPVAGMSIAGQSSGSLSATAAAGSANVNNSVEASWVLVPAETGTITFSGNFAIYLEAFASAGELFPGKASAATSFSITITDLSTDTLVYIFSPDLLNETTAANPDAFPVDLRTCGSLANVIGSCGIELAGFFEDRSGVLLAGTPYQLSLSTNVQMAVARAVAPGVCGDSLLNDGEQCDDGNTAAGDGCSATCQVEDGFDCTLPIPGDPPTPSVCTEILDSDGDGVPDVSDACPDTPAGEPVDLFGCSDSQLDDDNDGVSNNIDFCPNTAIPESVPTIRLGTNHWALADNDGIFDTTLPKGGGQGPKLGFTVEDTAGCSCEQIISALDLGKGHEKHGCSISAMEAFVELVNP